jgi:hypothetical protein
MMLSSSSLSRAMQIPGPGISRASYPLLPALTLANQSLHSRTMQTGSPDIHFLLEGFESFASLLRDQHRNRFATACDVDGLALLGLINQACQHIFGFGNRDPGHCFCSS